MTEPTSHDPASAGGRARKLWERLGRTQLSRRRAFWGGFAFLVVGSAAIIYERLSGELSGTTPLAAMMMIAFGLGEASGDTTHVAVTRIVAAVLVVAVIALWFVGADPMITRRQ